MRCISGLAVLVMTLVAGCASRGGAPPAAQRPAEIRVMSYNILNSFAKEGDHIWPLRKELVARTIRAYDPDLLGMQEVQADQYDYLTEQFPKYTPVGVAREDGVRKGEFVLILVRKSRFDVGESGTFWLSEKPEEVGSKSWDTAVMRICTWAVVKDRQAKQEFLLANTHFDHRGKEARLRSAELLAERLPKLAKGRPIVLTGDFNFREDAPPYPVMMQAGFVDTYRAVHPTPSPNEASFNGLQPRVEGKRIDFIFVTPGVKVLEAAIDRTRSPDGRLPSDHYPVTATIKW